MKVLLAAVGLVTLVACSKGKPLSPMGDSSHFDCSNPTATLEQISPATQSVAQGASVLWSLKVEDKCSTLHFTATFGDGANRSFTGQLTFQRNYGTPGNILESVLVTGVGTRGEPLEFLASSSVLVENEVPGTNKCQLRFSPTSPSVNAPFTAIVDSSAAGSVTQVRSIPVGLMNLTTALPTAESTHTLLQATATSVLVEAIEATVRIGSESITCFSLVMVDPGSPLPTPVPIACTLAAVLPVGNPYVDFTLTVSGPTTKAEFVDRPTFPITLVGTNANIRRTDLRAGVDTLLQVTVFDEATSRTSSCSATVRPPKIVGLVVSWAVDGNSSITINANRITVGNTKAYPPWNLQVLTQDASNNVWIDYELRFPFPWRGLGGLIVLPSDVANVNSLPANYSDRNNAVLSYQYATPQTGMFQNYLLNSSSLTRNRFVNLNSLKSRQGATKSFAKTDEDSASTGTDSLIRSFPAFSVPPPTGEIETHSVSSTEARFVAEDNPNGSAYYQWVICDTGRSPSLGAVPRICD